MNGQVFYKATLRRPRRPITISSRSGKTPTLIFPSSSLPRRSMRSFVSPMHHQGTHRFGKRKLVSHC